MSRLFDGVDDVMTFNLGASGGVADYAFGTQLVLCRFVSSASWASLIELERATANEARGGISRHGVTGGLSTYNTVAAVGSTEAGSGTSFTIGTGDNWCLYVVTKATGTASPTFYKVPLATGTRTTQQITNTLANSSLLASGFIRIGGNDDFANIRLSVAAVLPGIVLTGAQIDGIVSAKTTASILALTDANSWVVDDADAFAADLKGNHNRSAIIGTADDADDPAGWVYGLGGAPTPSGSASTTVGFTSAATGRRKALRAAVTTTGATSTATTRRRAPRAATTTVGMTSTATGTGATVRTGSASTQTALTSVATGRRKALAHHDEVGAVPPFTIPVAGVLTVTGVQSAATGIKPTTETHSGAAATTTGFTSAATGRRKALRAATSTTAVTSAATARRISRGTATTVAGFTSAAAGNDQPVETHQGAAATVCGLASTATGRRRALGAAVSVNGLASTATWRRRARDSCTTTVGLASTATGANGTAPVRAGSSGTVFAATSAATGRRVARGSCVSTVSFSSVARGRNPADGPLIYRTAPAGRIRRAGVGTIA